MDRKSFVKNIGVIGGCTLVLPTTLLQSCEYEPRVWSDLNANDVAFLDELAETIIPATPGLPGAKAAEVGKYMVTMVQDCLAPEDQDVFLTGLTSIEALCVERHGKPFEKLEDTAKLGLLEDIQAEAIDFAEANENAEPPVIHYFFILKDLAVSGYFTSKIGMTQARTYLPIPQKYLGCIDYDEQTSNPWAI
ncbi:gluconate 2-dehydrogenase subunit 3 family protein [Croceitalea sp. MTPC5]|uniref:gluconate 2-dehydrogenase subunit 3 family protein n=1 Tax=Croceitalea sp. MTPC5 TaxID=3056565 RepID=UPI002B3FBDD6|nr:gluconate 2-dehydrogenase subunit 3 family protein [Croceitalea sp. MTPC5]